jgi:hypothetical protein
MESVAKHDRERALRAIAFWSMAQAQGIELKQHIVEELGFGSLKAMKTQLQNWGMPDWVVGGESETNQTKSFRQ